MDCGGTERTGSELLDTERVVGGTTGEVSGETGLTQQQSLARTVQPHASAADAACATGTAGQPAITRLKRRATNILTSRKVAGAAEAVKGAVRISALSGRGMRQRNGGKGMGTGEEGRQI
ncbi:hypothetical protein LBMAG56_04650 [Verrucomicrobiota bacterium]|nr:hypothetical protein LBMAG56_04650 [Verrucomicrobiota bacterium]